MGRKTLRILRHAAGMVRRNLRSYSLLSVTIVMSFSLLLGYLGLMDSQHYNDYKILFSNDRNLISVFLQENSGSVAELLQQKAESCGTTHTLQTFYTGLLMDLGEVSLPTGEKLDGTFLSNIFCIPRGAWWLEIGGEKAEVTWLDGRERTDYRLESGQILMDEEMFYALGLDENGPTVGLRLTGDDAMSRRKVLEGVYTVVGTVPSREKIALDWETLAAVGGVTVADGYKPTLVFSTEDLSPAIQPELSWQRELYFYTDEPESVTQMIREAFPALYVSTVWEDQDRAMEIIRAEKETKAIVASVLLLLLGINLYSSFANALNDRKFEIGVKRAIGASKWSVIRQFLYEGMLVMVTDILLSVAIVTDIAIVYRLIREATPDEWGLHYDFILYISPYSVAIFAICAAVLTVVFSLVFAYKSTQVQIVDYLKAE